LSFLFALLTALVISMAVIPVMIRLAPRIGMVDQPDPRKVHAVPIARTGGIGIVLGALVPIALWLPMNDLLYAYLFGSLVLLAFGVWDDACELGHYVKFVGQFLAVIVVVYYGDLYVTHLPLLDAELTATIGKPFTVFAMVGVINALNHSDGLDGLAGGMSLLCLSAIAYLAYLVDEGAARNIAILIALATIGGILGFLRYNTHPARVFMGDGGSQFLGFTSGFLTVYLMEKINPALSPALPALILGLPIIDILAVFVQRVYHGMNWFRASRNHIHHRLLQLGFDHYEAVVIIYSVQIVLVACAIMFPYEPDLLILAVYAVASVAVFGFLIAAERGRWRAHNSKFDSRLTTVIQAVKNNKLFETLPIGLVTVSIPLLFVIVSILANDVPRDIGTVSAVLALIFLVYTFLRGRNDSIVMQAVSYVTAAFVVYLETKYVGSWASLLNTMEPFYFSVLAVTIGIIVRYSRKTEFKTTPLDYLVIFMVLFAGFLLHNLPDNAYLGPMVIKLVILFYGCELIFTYARNKQQVFNFPVLLSLCIIAFKGLIY
jgi:UDP-GlcNAc:undecaprenyl-phosphate GlcNAc-1-phosphate transferase